MRRLTGVLLAALLAVPGCSEGVRRAPPDAGLLAFATESQVGLRRSDGTVTTLAELPPGESVIGLAWSGNGRYVGWVRDGEAGIALTVHEPGSGDTATWNTVARRPVSDAILGTRDGFVVLGGIGRVAWVEPVVLLADGTPEFRDLRFLEPGLLAGDGTRVLVDSMGLRDVYDVRSDGTETKLFTDLGEEGEVRNAPLGPAAITADDRLVYATGTRVSACEHVPSLLVRDLANGAEVPVPQPSISGSEHVVATAVTTGPDGRTYAAVTTNPGDCPGAKRSALFVLDDDRWTHVTDDAYWGAKNAAGTLAVVRDSGALEVGGAEVATGVTYAAWNPLGS